jgi:hypothetical protein
MALRHVNLTTPLDVVDRWVALLRQHPVTGRQVFDAQLVAAMLGNGMTRLYTFNRTDFECFAGLQSSRRSADSLFPWCLRTWTGRAGEAGIFLPNPIMPCAA